MCLKNSDDSYIYFLRPIGLPGPTKIGCSILPQGRLKQLAVWSPIPLELVGVVAGNMVLEARIHARFAHLHSHHEWFRADPELDAAIASMLAGTFDFCTLPPPRRIYEDARAIKLGVRAAERARSKSAVPA